MSLLGDRAFYQDLPTRNKQTEFFTLGAVWNEVDAPSNPVSRYPCVLDYLLKISAPSRQIIAKFKHRPGLSTINQPESNPDRNSTTHRQSNYPFPPADSKSTQKSANSPQESPPISLTLFSISQHRQCLQTAV